MEDDSVIVEELRRSSVAFLKKILDGEADVPSNAVFKNSCEGLLQAADTVGLCDEDLCLISDLIWKIGKSIDFGSFSCLMSCLVPESFLPVEVVKKLQKWLLKHFWNDSETSKCDLILQWMASGIHYGVIDKKHLQNHFTVMFHILKKFALSKSACTVIALTSEPEYFSHNSVHIILEMQEKTTKDKTPPRQYTYLLRFIKTFRPELVPFQVAQISAMAALAVGSSKKFNAAMETVKRRNTGSSTVDEDNLFESNFCENELLTDITATYGDVDASVHENVKLRNKKHILAKMEFSMQSALQTNKSNRIKLNEIKSFKELGKNWHNVIIPDCLISLLCHKYGHYLLAFGSEDLQSRFLLSLYERLQVMVLSEQHQSKQVSNLFSLIVKFEKFIQQGLPTVAEFLCVYLAYWNGLDYRSSIFELISWITFDTYEELNQYVLRPLFNLFISTPTALKCDIIECLTNLFSNMVLFTIRREKLNQEYLFLPKFAVPNWASNPDGVIINIIDFVEKLINVALLQEPCDILLLSAVFNFYERVHSLEIKYELGTMTVIPTQVVHQALLCHSLEPINRAAKLLLSYRTSVSNYDEEELSKLAPQLKTIETNVKEIYYTLFKKEVTSTQIIDSESVKQLDHFVNINHAMRHPTMLIPHFYHVRENIDFANPDPSEILKIYGPDLYDLFKLCEEAQV